MQSILASHEDGIDECPSEADGHFIKTGRILETRYSDHR